MFALYLRLVVAFVDVAGKPVKLLVSALAAHNPDFRERVILWAQAYHKMTVNLQRRLYGHATNVDIKPLNEERAVATAADLVGELVVFGVAGALVIAEVSRSAYSEGRKEEARKQEREALRAKTAEMEAELRRVSERLDALEKSMGDSWLPRVFSQRPKELQPQQQPQQHVQNEQHDGQKEEALEMGKHVGRLDSISSDGSQMLRSDFGEGRKSASLQ